MSNLRAGDQHDLTSPSGRERRPREVLAPPGVPQRRRGRHRHRPAPQGRQQAPDNGVELTGGHDYEIATFQVAGQGLDEELRQTVARPFEDSGRGLEAGLGAVAQGQAPKCEVHERALTRHLGCAGEKPQSEPLPGTGHCMKETAVVNELDEASLRYCLAQLGRIRKARDAGVIPFRTAAAVADGCLDSSLLG